MSLDKVFDAPESLHEISPRFWDCWLVVGFYEVRLSCPELSSSAGTRVPPLSDKEQQPQQHDVVCGGEIDKDHLSRPAGPT